MRLLRNSSLLIGSLFGLETVDKRLVVLVCWVLYKLKNVASLVLGVFVIHVSLETFGFGENW